MNQNTLALTMGLLGILLAALAFITPEIRCYFGLKTEIGCPADADDTPVARDAVLIGRFTVIQDQQFSLPGVLAGISIKLTGFDNNNNPVLSIKAAKQPNATQRYAAPQNSTTMLEFLDINGIRHRLAFKITKVDPEKAQIKLRITEKF